MKNAKRILSIVLVAVMFSCMFVFANAADTTTPEQEIITEEYVVLSGYNCRITISGITANMFATASSKYSTTLSIKMELQKQRSNGVYETIETYNASNTGTSLVLEKSRLINALATYRLKVTFTAGSESAVSYAYP